MAQKISILIGTQTVKFLFMRFQMEMRTLWGAVFEATYATLWQ
jgi:hypothetical protein